MTQTYAQLQKQISVLQQKAEAAREREIAGVIERIKVAIDHYALTPDQLFNGRGGIKAGAPKRGGKSTFAKFRDAQGNTWSGRGPRPRWLRDAIAAGTSLDDLLVDAASIPSDSTAPAATVVATPGRKKAKRAKRAKRAPSKVTYSDGAGKTWTGRGPKPGWVKAALEAGRTLEELANN